MSDQPTATPDVLREIANRLGVDLDVVTLLHPTAREAHDLDPFAPKDAA